MNSDAATLAGYASGVGKGHDMKPSQRNDISGFIFGAIAAGGLWWFLPFFHWAVYLVFGMMIAGWAIIAGGILGAAERSMDRE